MISKKKSTRYAVLSTVAFTALVGTPAMIADAAIVFSGTTNVQGEVRITTPTQLTDLTTGGGALNNATVILAPTIPGSSFDLTGINPGNLVIENSNLGTLTVSPGQPITVLPGVSQPTVNGGGIISVGLPQVAPTNLAGVAPTLIGIDGKITGTTLAMEYRLKGAMIFTPATATEITGLATGTYEVRFSAKPGYAAGAITQVVVPVYAAPPATAVILEGGSDGTAGNTKVTGLTVNTKYVVKAGSTFYGVLANGMLSAAQTSKLAAEALAIGLTGTEITGLTNGATYLVIEVAEHAQTATRLAWAAFDDSTGYDNLIEYDEDKDLIYVKFTQVMKSDGADSVALAENYEFRGQPLPAGSQVLQGIYGVTSDWDGVTIVMPANTWDGDAATNTDFTAAFKFADGEALPGAFDVVLTDEPETTLADADYYFEAVYTEASNDVTFDGKTQVTYAEATGNNKGKIDEIFLEFNQELLNGLAPDTVILVNGKRFVLIDDDYTGSDYAEFEAEDATQEIDGTTTSGLQITGLNGSIIINKGSVKDYAKPVITNAALNADKTKLTVTFSEAVTADSNRLFEPVDSYYFTVGYEEPTAVEHLESSANIIVLTISGGARLTTDNSIYVTRNIFDYSRNNANGTSFYPIEGSIDENDLEAVDPVIDAIYSVYDVLLADPEEFKVKVVAAREAYELLSPEVLVFVANYPLLVNAEALVEPIQEMFKLSLRTLDAIDAYMAADGLTTNDVYTNVQAVITEFNALAPREMTAENIGAIIETLLAAVIEMETATDELKASNLAITQPIFDAIAALPNILVTNPTQYAQAVANANSAYVLNISKKAQKDLITNYSILLEAVQYVAHNTDLMITDQNVVVALDNTNKTLTVSNELIDVGDLKRSIASAIGARLSFEVMANGAYLLNIDQISTGDQLIVKTQSGLTVVTYTISVD